MGYKVLSGAMQNENLQAVLLNHPVKRIILVVI